MSNLFVRSRTVIKRTFKEIEPKLAVGLLTGSVTGFVLDLLAQNHVSVPTSVQHFIVIGGFFVGGYIKSSSFPTIQEIEEQLPQAAALAQKVTNEAAQHPETVKHPVTLSTSPVAVVAPINQPGKFDDILRQFPSAGGQVNTADNAATQKLN